LKTGKELDPNRDLPVEPQLSNKEFDPNCDLLVEPKLSNKV